MGSLARSADDRIVGGVAGGLAEWLRVDPTVMRVAFVALTFANGIGLVAYVLLLVVLPTRSPSAAAGSPSIGEDPPTTPIGAPVGAETAEEAAADARRAARIRTVIGLGVVLVGSWLLARQLGVVPDLRWPIVGPLALMGVGLILLVGRTGADGERG